MTLKLIVGGVLLLLLLFVARGVHLIGQGGEAEQAARDSLDGEIGRNGWFLLDWAREGDIPVMSAIEERLGINQDDTEEGDDGE